MKGKSRATVYRRCPDAETTNEWHKEKWKTTEHLYLNKLKEVNENRKK